MSLRGYDSWKLNDRDGEAAAEEADQFADALWEWRQSINPRDIAIEKVNEDVASALDSGIAVPEWGRAALLTIWECIYGRADRTKLGELGYQLNCNEERPS